MTDWTELSARAGLASHRLIGWIYWDPDAIARYAALGVPSGVGYYVASRSAPLAPAGPEVVTAAFYSIHEEFIRGSLSVCAAHTTWPQVYAARNAAVADGLRRYVPQIDRPLGEMDGRLWAAAESLPVSGRVMHAAHRAAPRPHDPLVSAWLAVNCIREWRGDTHWAIVASEGLSGVQAGILHNAFLNYPHEWIPRSRGADDSAMDAAWDDLGARGLAAREADGWRVTDAGHALRESIEVRTDTLAEAAWRSLGEADTLAFLDIVEPVGPALMARVDATAGPEWMPAGRDRRS